MKKNSPFFVIISSLVLFFTSCSGDDPKDPIIPNEEEVITTLKYVLTTTDNSSNVTFIFEDLDGDGGNVPVITGGILFANQTYTGSLILLNELELPAESISDEVAEEADEHQFFYSSSVSGLTISYSDTDSNGNPIGLSTSLSTTSAGIGSITITLRHEPDKNATGVSNGDITNAGGETDIEVTFDVEVQ